MTDTGPQSAQKKRFPVALGIGLVLVAIALVGAITGGGSWPLLIVGVILAGVGLIQQSIERGRSTS